MKLYGIVFFLFFVMDSTAAYAESWFSFWAPTGGGKPCYGFNTSADEFRARDVARRKCERDCGGKCTERTTRTVSHVAIARGKDNTKYGYGSDVTSAVANAMANCSKVTTGCVIEFQK